MLSWLQDPCQVITFKLTSCTYIFPERFFGLTLQCTYTVVSSAFWSFRRSQKQMFSFNLSCYEDNEKVNYETHKCELHVDVCCLLYFICMQTQILESFVWSYVSNMSPWCFPENTCTDVCWGLCARMTPNYTNKGLLLCIYRTMSFQDELRRIEAAGGQVHSVRGIWRVNLVLSVSRAIGKHGCRHFEMMHCGNLSIFSLWLMWECTMLSRRI